MKKFILSIAIFLFATFKSFGHVEHYANFNYLEYELFRNNQSIGYHKFDFKRPEIKKLILNAVQSSWRPEKIGPSLIEKFKNNKSWV